MNEEKVELKQANPLDDAASIGHVYITRRATFAASHRLHNPDFDDEKNRRVFGLCNNPNGHGHNYVLEVTVSGEVDGDTGMVVNLKDLKRVIQDRILDDCDHRNLNVDVSWLEGINPTAENLALAFWRKLETEIAPASLAKIRVLESADNVAEYMGPGGRI